MRNSEWGITPRLVSIRASPDFGTLLGFDGFDTPSATQSKPQPGGKWELPCLSSVNLKFQGLKELNFGSHLRERMIEAVREIVPKSVEAR